MYVYIYIFVSPLEITNIPCTQGDQIHIYMYVCIYIYIYIREYDENLLNIFFVCCSKPSYTEVKLIIVSFVVM